MNEKKGQKILILNDNPEVAQLFREYLGENYEIFHAGTWLKGKEIYRKKSPDLVIVDSYLPDASGLGMIAEIKSMNFSTPVLLLAANENMKYAVATVKQGDFDYLVKPLDSGKINNVINQILMNHEPAPEKPINNIVFKSKAMADILTTVSLSAETNASIILFGESGTGKELIAKEIHLRSKRAGQSFVAINCAAVPENLLESELFGFEKGAFSGASATKKGKIELANGGTLFLDEIGDMSFSTQAKLLRVLEQRQLEHLGGVKPIDVDLRLISATNRPLRQMVDNGEFRLDLYYRLAVIPIRIPPLRDRKEDIMALAEHFLKESNDKYYKKIRTFSADAVNALEAYSWPGNARELKNVVEQMVVLHNGPVIEASQLPINIREMQPSAEANWQAKKQKMEKQEICYVLRMYKGNRTKSAEHLCMSVRNLQLIIKKYNIKPEEYK
jgi:DNA-binding NtrC family response regulator